MTRAAKDSEGLRSDGGPYLPEAAHPMRRDNLAWERLTARKLFASLVLAVLGYGAAVALLQVAVGDPLTLYAPDRSVKMLMLRQLPPFTTAAFGSSMTHLGFDPRAFDRQMVGTRLSGRSVNLGLSAGAQVEEPFMARLYFDRLGPSRPACMILLEQNAEPEFALTWMEHPREINEMDFASANLIGAFPPLAPTPLRRMHLRAAAYVAAALHTIRSGMLSNRIFPPEIAPKDYQEEVRDDQRGFLVHDPSAAARQEVLKTIAEAPVKPDETAAPLSYGHVLILEKVHALRPQDNLRMVEVLYPRLNHLYRHTVFPESVRTSFGNVPIVDLASPERYPQFYRPELWSDTIHLSEKGAQLVSQELARQIKLWYAIHPPTANAACQD